MEEIGLFLQFLGVNPVVVGGIIAITNFSKPKLLSGEKARIKSVAFVALTSLIAVVIMPDSQWELGYITQNTLRYFAASIASYEAGKTAIKAVIKKEGV